MNFLHSSAVLLVCLTVCTAVSGRNVCKVENNWVAMAYALLSFDACLSQAEFLLCASNVLHT